MTTRENIEALEARIPAVWPHYITPPRTLGFVVVGPKLVEDEVFLTEEEALEEAAKRIAGHETNRVTINRIETHMEVLR